MKKYLLLLSATFLFLYSCTNNALQTNSDETDVINVVKSLLVGMHDGDSSEVRKIFTNDALLQTIIVENGKTIRKKESLEDFLIGVGSPHEKIWDERIKNYIFLHDGALAAVWLKYDFYYGNEYLHSGVDLFELMKTEQGWKIFSLTDTRH